MIEIKQGDTRHAIQAILKKANGTPVNLSEASVRFLMGVGNRKIIEGYAQLTSTPGEVWYVFNDGETDKPGYYRAEFIVTYKDGKVETFPHDKAISVRINERIGGI